MWPQIGPGVEETRKDHYCNLILNLQKVAYETNTIELAELRGALTYLMASADMRAFWSKARAARAAVTDADAAEDFFTREVDHAFVAAAPSASEMPTRLGFVRTVARNLTASLKRTV